jgi:flagellar hook-basal body complex protein FliE
MNIKGASQAYGTIQKMDVGTVPDLEEKQGPSFSELVSEGVSNVTDKIAQSEQMTAKGMAGEAQLHEVVTAVAEAELALTAITNIRDKVINAYQDIIKMPI